MDLPADLYHRSIPILSIANFRLVGGIYEIHYVTETVNDEGRDFKELFSGA